MARIVNVPSRRIGETTVKSLLEEADQSSITLWTLILDNAQGTKNTKTKLTKLTEQSLSSFVNIILTARKKFMESAGSGLSIIELIDHVVKKISFEDYLEKSHPEDHESRWANVEELISQASDYTDPAVTGYEDDEALPEVDGLRQEDQSNPLSRFLANIALASDVKAADASAPQPQVTISTIHAAKGLEWPVVFIPAVYEGSIPHSRAEDTDEERRLLYVAMTRAKALLYLSYPIKNSQRELATISPFLAPSSLRPFLDDKGPTFNHNLIQSITLILNRPFPLNIDFEGLPSLEDDLWPLNGEEADEERRKWEGSDGNPHYTQGQRPAKRQRIDNNEISKSTRETWQPANMTTMDQVATFSTASTTLKSGFVSAGSHLKVLSEKSINFAGEKSASLITKGARGNASVSEEQIRDQKLGKASKSRNIRGSEEQKNIASFFTMPNPPPRKPPGTVFATQRVPPKEHKNNSQSATGLSIPGSAPANGSGILPSLANHRLGTAKLSAPGRYRIEEESLNKKPYVCFSSSPPRPEALIQEAERTSAVKPVEFDVAQGVEIVMRVQPAKTMHTTTMSHMNTLTKKSLGVRRDLKGWGNRKGQGFVVPSMSKRP